MTVLLENKIKPTNERSGLSLLTENLDNNYEYLKDIQMEKKI